MMILTSEVRSQYSQILNYVAESLDISPTKYMQAVERYKAVGKYLEEGFYPGVIEMPEIYPQGSMRYGTVVRPVKHGEEKEFDIDLLCEFDIYKYLTSPKHIKRMVGDRLNENKIYLDMLDKEGRRCWTLNYAEEDEIGFHIDILPVIPEDDIWKNELIYGMNVEAEFAQNAIVLTDLNRNTMHYSWSQSNPKGFAAWFDKKQEIILNETSFIHKTEIFENNRNIFMRIEDVPDQLIRTPLQRSIQLLKRHRDIRFANSGMEEDKPISMIITTLAAKAYQNEDNVYEALVNIISQIEDYLIHGLIKKHNGNWYIPNPVNPAENFAERWHEDNDRKANAFFKWIKWIREDLLEIIQHKNMREIGRHFNSVFGQRSTKYAFDIVGEKYKYLQQNQMLGIAPGSGTLGIGASISSKPHTFYADQN